MKRSLLLSALLVSSTFASDPGQPLDCSDMVFHVPGLTCVPLVPIGELPGGDPFALDLWNRGSDLAVDNLGRILLIKQVSNGSIEILRESDTGFEAIASVTIRTSPYGWDGIHPRCTGWNCGEYRVPDGITFDATNGRLLVPLMSQSSVPTCGGCYEQFKWLAAIEGFATSFEILQSYSPTSGPINFRVAYMPEGFPAADWFDTYYGDIATVGDWSQAQPLECEYPASMPEVGDYLAVGDPLPNPAPGQGRYYVTAISYQGQKRYGRQSIGGVLAGRDPVVLPACE